MSDINEATNKMTIQKENKMWKYEKSELDKKINQKKQRKQTTIETQGAKYTIKREI